MLKDRITITVDGLAGSGKTALAKMLAEKLVHIPPNVSLIIVGVIILVSMLVSLLAARHGPKPPAPAA